jgi:hypothetical protein
MNIVNVDAKVQQYVVANMDLAIYTNKILEKCVHFCSSIDNFDTINDSISAKL